MCDLKELIRRCGKTQAETARAIGVRPQYIRAINAGERTLAIKYVEPICKFLCITPNVLFGWEREGKK